ncbi:MAG: hypothetical protein JWR59_1227, partial [Brevundimonas sp.]|nr:hypothetical protein [Brevundimonas sp.]
IESALHDPRISEDRRLLYLGEYLHVVADSVVHPENPLLGHFLKGHRPDRADLDPNSLTIVTGLLDQKIMAFRKDQASPGSTQSALAPTQQADLDRIRNRPFYGDPRKARFYGQVDHAIVDSWTRSYPNEQPCSSAMKCLEVVANRGVALELDPLHLGAGSKDIYFDSLELERQARATSEIARVVGSYVPYRSELPPTGEGTISPGHGYDANRQRMHDEQIGAIPLDANGEPVGTAEHSFGPALSGGTPFAETLAADPALRSERESVTLTQEFRASADAAGSEVQRELGMDIPQDVIDSERKAAAWVPPSSPGGVALNPSLDLPLAGLGTPIRIESENGALFLRTDKGRIRFDGVSARSFATLARAIAEGEIPYLSIGSEPSDRPGFARVTYAPALHGTVEGHALYDADVQFKTIFARLPLTRDAHAHGLEPLLAGFPGLAGDFTRLWITSSNIRLTLDGDRFVTADHGMRINAETRLQFAVRSDPEMDAYAAQLTGHWAAIANALPQFRSVQRLALTTAIVFWARDHHVAIDPAILLIPPEGSLTPDYAPIVGVLDANFAVAGGVSLAPEDRDTQLGRAFLSYIALTLSQSDSRQGVWLGRASLALKGLLLLCAVLALPAFLLWLIVRRGLNGATFRRLLSIWSGICAGELLVIALLQPLLLGDLLSFFDRDFLALLVTLVLFPMLLFAALARRFGGQQLTPWPRRAVLAFGFFGPVAVAGLGLGLACMTVAMTGPVPSAALNRLVSAQVAPSEVLGEAFVTRLIRRDQASTYLLPVPQSLGETFRPEFELRRFSGNATAEIHPDGGDPNLPVKVLKRVDWPPAMKPRAGVTYYTADGRPPL